MARCLLHSSGNTLCTLDLALSESSDGQPKTWHERCSSVACGLPAWTGNATFRDRTAEERFGGVAGLEPPIRFSQLCKRKVRLIISCPKTARSLGKRTCS